MGKNLFGANISGQIAKALGPLLLPGKLFSKSPGTRTTSTGGRNPKTKVATFRGILDTYADSQVDGTVIKKGDRKVLMLGDTLPSGRVPEPNDEVEIESRRFRIVNVERDPDAAAYTCQVRATNK